MAQEIVEVPITGKIISVNVKPGDQVQEGDVICILESMKMENPILAPLSSSSLSRMNALLTTLLGNKDSLNRRCF